MIGQEKLVNKLQSYNLKTLPHTLLFLGDKGCGKHLLCDELSKYFNIKLFDITDNINLDIIENIYLNAFPAFYIIDMTKVNEKQQNMLLKLIEEPSEYIYIILLSENKLSLLNTIINRCMIFEFENYKIDDLKQFTSECDDRLFQLCNTPGQIKLMSINKLDELYKLCANMLDKINVASLPNTLTIADKLNYKEDYDKFNVNLFLKALSFTTLQYFKENKVSIQIYNIINSCIKKLRDSRFDKNKLIQSMLIDLWKGVRNG